MRRILLCAALLVLLAGISRVSAQDGGSILPVLQALGGEECTEGGFICVTLPVPLNHFAADRPRTIDVVFAVLPATAERYGMFVTVTGGPGSSGILSADDYTSVLDADFLAHYDQVFFDQRGIGRSGDLRCDAAYAAYVAAPTVFAAPAQQQQVIDAARTFAQGCIAEMGDAGALLLPFVGTRQAIEDLELFRQAIGDETFWLYGESYGTQFVQTYAAAYPQRLAGLFLDGTVDLTLTGAAFYRQQARAFNDVLVATLDACTDAPDCAGDFPDGDARAFYDDLTAELKTSPALVNFPLPDAAPAPRPFTFSDLEAAAASTSYGLGSRADFLRALAAAGRGDLVPLLRLSYSEGTIDPLTLAYLPDEGYSDGMYYAVDCADYQFGGGTPDEVARGFVDAALDVASTQPYMAAIYLTDLPCAFWSPVTPDALRPEPNALDGVTVMVFNSTLDPATPYGNGRAVFDRLADGYHLTVEGGRHVVFGLGFDCVDTLVYDWMLDGTLPDERDLTCPSDVYVDYVPLSPTAFVDILDALMAFETELLLLPEYVGWDLVSTLAIGCPYGGTAVFAPSKAGEQWTLTGCAFHPDYVFSGEGQYDYDTGDITLDVQVTGAADGVLSYVDSGGDARVTGSYDGADVNLP